jgi:hypothetical protein
LVFISTFVRPFSYAVATTQAFRLFPIRRTKAARWQSGPVFAPLAQQTVKQVYDSRWSTALSSPAVDLNQQQS